MFCEYAVLYGRISGHVGASLPTPMTLTKAASINQQASDFVIKFVTPLLGIIFSTKFHKVLRHIFDAVRLHGNLRNGNKSANEAYHKTEKAFYGRTNKDFESFTHQLVRHAQGSREIVAKHIRKRKRAEGGGPDGDAADAVGAGADSAGAGGDVEGAGGDMEGAGGDSARVDGDVYVPAACGPQPGPGTCSRANEAAARADGVRGRRSDYLHTETVAEICKRPGIAAAGDAMGLDPAAKVSVISLLSFTGRLDCNGLQQQLLYAHTWFRGGPWVDAVLYNIGDDDSVPYMGEVRAMVRYPDMDVAIIREWEPVEPVPGCPFAARGCQRLKWLVQDGDTAVSVREVPIANVCRLAHVVPAVLTHLTAHQGSLRRVYKTSSIQPQTTTPQRKYRCTNAMRCFSHLWRRQRPASAHLRGVDVTRSA